MNEDFSNCNVGQRIKEIRKQQSKTLQQLSAESGLSSGYLSNLERNVISPTIYQLQKVCFALNVNITDVLTVHDTPVSPVVRADERDVFFAEKGKVKYEMLSPGENDIEAICITVEKGITYERTSWGHDYDEIAIITQGSLCIEMLDQEFVINAGDTIYIKKNTLHTFKNIGDSTCVSYWFYKKK
ncbi:helix-turn-helix transcriptional regulator [Klebsiella sp. RHBSTW-00215]|uniref:helix-turn-helix domain-containing protein n=1 Tax=unclassified Klebsiella TaxID=2608929 RepID=UPI0015F459C2|nr:XRE family transcriptional regulator [Klebsiella sp. RHBSTW-00215]MBA7934812.1 helix-turn-helix transcriptional regulator [Klebsiella sp. RHBSTW-00215]